MKILSFNYTDVKGKQSHRTLAVSIEPGDKYAGVDISELLASDIADYSEECDNAKADYLYKLETINRNFDLKHNYRQFTASKMTDIETL